ncbi:RNA polymerase II transcription factor B 52 kDa subunit [Coemansia sp. S16]|nr:RNA polymerase II transcription factor B 52 kDa subunit [Coemansia sp. S680]KAJ2036121.1 RNA polymerase II transcription factor B 52 kDa subunit [Coemansia sp. S3946]KAJ2054263.1 RNA polymerase II transcription factor B 52 kDa subunit [Coemansia sp. S16]KAJ2067754.1 RNA polymerase II transcription factor B 52 kDa subunit [Coemansia sp. S2]KAJ2074860.1 RNA polymerase II transcription factor B 52 kDa subunit [Coemansia sp. S155-1]
MATQMGSEEEFKSTIAEYLESLPTQFCRRVFSNPAACLAIFRLLSTVGKQLVMSMLYLDSAIKLQDVYQWAKVDHQPLVRSKVHQLRKLQILTEEKGTVSLNPIFREQLRNALTGGGDFSSFGIPYTGAVSNRGVSKKWLASYANDRWEAILHFMVGHSADAEPPSESVRGILRMSRLMENSEEGMKITNSGFQFLLQDSSSQVWTVLLQYLRLAEQQDMDVVEVLNFMFQLVSLQLGRPYSTEALTRNQRKMLAELCSFGLLYQDSVGAPQFYPTHLITSLSSGSASHSGPSGTDSSVVVGAGGGTGRSAIPTGSKATGELAKPSDQGFIILETNCRMYAYTNSALQIAILNLFVHLVNRFPNFITGALTRDSVRRALSRGITADQIITFLTTHAHPQMQGRTPVLPITVTDQIRLWEQERNRLRPTPAYFYKDFGQKQEYERMFKYAQDIGVILWASNEKRQLVVTRQGHAKIAELVKSQRAAAAAAAAK